MQTSRTKAAARPQKAKKLKDEMQANEDQAKRFIETARQIGCDEDKERFEKKLGRIASFRPARETVPADVATHWSDCAVIRPAYEPGPCNCGGFKAVDK